MSGAPDAAAPRLFFVIVVEDGMQLLGDSFSRLGLINVAIRFC